MSREDLVAAGGYSGFAGTPGAVDRVLGRLQRVTSSGRFIPEIDGLRFVAIALVFLVHMHFYTALKSSVPYVSPPHVKAPDANPLIQVVQQGYRGVELFFVISGFILAMPFAEHALASGPRVALGKYYWRRVTRLEPPYLLCMSLLLVPLLLRALMRGTRAGELFEHYLASCAYLHGPIYGTKSPINFVAWSLEIEVQFYLIVPLLTGIFTIRRASVRRGAIAAAMIGLMAFQYAIGIDRYPRLALSILNYGQYFLAGFLLADLYLTGWVRTEGKSIGWDVVSLALWPALYLASARAGAWEVTIPFLLVPAYVAVFRGRIANAALTNRWITTIGGMCYSIYLLHVPLLTGFGKLTLPLTAHPRYWVHFTLNAALLAIPVLVFSAVYFAAVERPCMRRDWPQRLHAWVLDRLGSLGRRPSPFGLDAGEPGS